MVLRLDVHGLRVAVSGDWPKLVGLVRRDWAWFVDEGEADGATGLSVEIRRRKPDLAAFGPLRASYETPRNVVFTDGDRLIVDYTGRAAVVFDRPARHALVEGVDEGLVHEVVWHLLLSQTGAHVESIGLPRLHALGLAGPDGAVAVLLPSGGGKSRLALGALADPDVRLVSDDMPLLDRRAHLHPFPLGISVNVGDAHLLPGDDVQRTDRMEFHPRVLLPVTAIAHRFETRPRPLRHLVVATRSLAPAPSLSPVSRRHVVVPLLRQGVIGLDLFQGMEFLLRQGFAEALRSAGPAKRRLASCTAAFRHAQTWSLMLGLDDGANWAALRKLLVRG